MECSMRPKAEEHSLPQSEDGKALAEGQRSVALVRAGSR